jgi:antibiotic biosynthesis monooxygenase (ABM) superfamily enzyme
METVHVAVTRQVKPGWESAFEEALREFARESLHVSGTTVVTLAWGVMPLLTRVFSGWLHRAANGNQESDP